MLEAGMSVLVAVSGGRDSVVLARVLSRLAATRLSGCRLAIAHFNHRARGQASDADEAFVESLAVELGLPFHRGRLDVVGVARRERRNFEEVAREARYRFLRECAASIGAARIATGHTLSDQAETVLMRLIRGAGMDGLSAIHPVVDGLIIRPLINVSREETTRMCEAESWPFREDATNLDRRRVRNLIRLELLPWLRRLNPRVEEALGRLAQSALSDEECLDQIVSNLKKELVISLTAGELTIPAEALLETRPALRYRLIRESIRSLRPDRRTVDSRRLDSIQRLLAAGVSGRRIDIGEGMEVWMEFGTLRFRRCAPPGERVPVNENSPARFGAFIVSLSCGIRQGTGPEDRESWNVHDLDGNLLPQELAIRCRRAGDAYTPVAHRTPKKVKDLMIASRIPASERAAWPLLVDAKADTIVCGPQLPLNRNFAPRDPAIRRARIRWERADLRLDGC
ncbi:MAG: tRNA lysidine(34) synthetase TilS [Acidobacteria bacterium]|nr:tRNA lysidine(34) synthetase TilS [Acidobacteriota bacterium]